MVGSWNASKLSPFWVSPPSARFEEPVKTTGLASLKSITMNLSWMTCPAPPVNSLSNGGGTCLMSAEKGTSTPELGEDDRIGVIEIDHDELVVDDLSRAASKFLVERRRHLLDERGKGDQHARLPRFVEGESEEGRAGG